jgi:hypothetical protein
MLIPRELERKQDSKGPASQVGRVCEERDEKKNNNTHFVGLPRSH